MNTNDLAKHYHCFSPWERLPLLLSAAARNDEVEHDRLTRSAPELRFRVPNFWGLAEGLESLAKLYMLEQLDLAVFYERVNGFLEVGAALLGDKEATSEGEETLQTLAYRFVARADGWKLFCAELHIDPDVPLRQLPGYDSIRALEKVAREIACTREQAIAHLRQGGEGDEPATPAVGHEQGIATAEGEARSMRQFLEEYFEAWS